MGGSTLGEAGSAWSAVGSATAARPSSLVISTGPAPLTQQFEDRLFTVQQVNLPTLPDPPLPETSRPVVHSSKILTPSDTSTHGGSLFFGVMQTNASHH